MNKLIVASLAASLGLAIPTSAIAAPVQCYIGKDGSYQICDLREVGPSKYILIWPDGDRTAIIETVTPSGSWIEVRHTNPNGTPYGGGVRYPVPHYEQGEWLCYHKQPSSGSIDFCMKP